MEWRDFERLHYKRVNAYARALERILDDAAAEAARAAELFARVGPAGEAFSFAQRPALQRRLNGVLRGMHRAVFTYLEKAVAREWDLAEESADSLAAAYCRARGLPPTAEEQRRWFRRCTAAREAFTARRAAGLNLSERVWRLTEAFKEELEQAVASALEKGAPAAGLAGEVKRYLKEPNRRFRRVRGKDGRLHLSRPARAYHPGAGVYRSSYRNARRLAVTETNMAYRAADHARWQRMDFVVGIEIRLSNNHNCKGIPAGAFHDVCDELAGRYPKEFKFVGWHPHCRCVAVPILQSPGPLGGGAAEGLARGGGAPLSGGAVRALPAQFVGWARANGGRLAAGAARGRLPYFVKDNFGVLGRQFFNDVSDRLNYAAEPFQHTLYASFEPFSPAIIEAIRRAKDRRMKNAIFESILDDPRAVTLFESDAAKTTIYFNHKGRRSPTWLTTQTMAQTLNLNGISVCFLPERDRVSCADALLKLSKRRWAIADFKVSNTRNSNTLAESLIKGFKQADMVVIKMVDGDAGTLADALEYVKRNEKVKPIVIVTKYSKVIELSEKDVLRGKYKNKIRGKI